MVVAESFKDGSDRLDVYFADRLSNSSELKALWGFVKILLNLSHGQASVERGFSVNKQAEEVNLAEESLVARRCIVDHIRRVSLIIFVFILNRNSLNAIMLMMTNGCVMKNYINTRYLLNNSVATTHLSLPFFMEW